MQGLAAFGSMLTVAACWAIWRERRSVCARARVHLHQPWAQALCRLVGRAHLDESWTYWSQKHGN